MLFGAVPAEISVVSSPAPSVLTFSMNASWVTLRPIKNPPTAAPTVTSEMSAAKTALYSGREAGVDGSGDFEHIITANYQR